MVKDFTNVIKSITLNDISVFTLIMVVLVMYHDINTNYIHILIIVD